MKEIHLAIVVNHIYMEDMRKYLSRLVIRKIL